MKNTSASNELKTRFGLNRQPTNTQVKRWAQIVKRHIGSGYSASQAGAVATKHVFPDSKFNHVYCEADTIETLLHLAEGKGAANNVRGRRVKTISSTSKLFYRGKK